MGPPEGATIFASSVALVATILAAVIAVGWPSWRAQQIRRRFRSLIRRELQEIGPYVPDADPHGGQRPWWEYLSKRFVHEEFFARERITDHRDFVLSLDPDLVYLLSQLWISFEKRDGRQWSYYLSKLAENKHVATEELKSAAEDWKRLLLRQRTEPWVRDAIGRRRNTVERVDGLFEARLNAYRELVAILTSASMADAQARLALTNRDDGQLEVWYRRFGLHLSGDALHRYLQVRDLLTGEGGHMLPDATTALGEARSALRAELKIDLGVRHPDERAEPRDQLPWRG